MEFWEEEGEEEGSVPFVGPSPLPLPPPPLPAVGESLLLSPHRKGSTSASTTLHLASRPLPRASEAQAGTGQIFGAGNKEPDDAEEEEDGGRAALPLPSPPPLPPPAESAGRTQSALVHPKSSGSRIAKEAKRAPASATSASLTLGCFPLLL